MCVQGSELSPESARLAAKTSSPCEKAAPENDARDLVDEERSAVDAQIVGDRMDGAKTLLMLRDPSTEPSRIGQRMESSVCNDPRTLPSTTESNEARIIMEDSLSVRSPSAAQPHPADRDSTCLPRQNGSSRQGQEPTGRDDGSFRPHEPVNSRPFRLLHPITPIQMPPLILPSNGRNRFTEAMSRHNGYNIHTNRPHPHDEEECWSSGPWESCCWQCFNALCPECRHRCPGTLRHRDCQDRVVQHCGKVVLGPHTWSECCASLARPAGNMG